MPPSAVSYADAKAQVAHYKAIADSLDAPLTSLCCRLFRTNNEEHTMNILYTRRMGALGDLHFAEERLKVIVIEKRWRDFLVEAMGNTTGTVMQVDRSVEDFVAAEELSVGRLRAEATFRRVKTWAAARGWTLTFLGGGNEGVVVAPGVAGLGEEGGEGEKVKEEKGEQARKEKTKEMTSEFDVEKGLKTLAALEALIKAAAAPGCE